MPLPAIISALLKPDAHPDLPHDIELRQTHISYLIFTPEFVYKIKKPVDFGFLDFTSIEKRKYFCNQEIILNKRLCQDMYIGVVEIRQHGGDIKIDGPGGTVEYAVKMKRLPAEKMLDRMLQSSGITPALIERIAEIIAGFHKKAETNPHILGFGSIDMIGRNTDENFSQSLQFVGNTLSRERYGLIKNYSEQFLREHTQVFEKRVADGFIKNCHGDMHAEDICAANGIYIFDCIEFNERFRYIDTVSDIAFLAMDIDYHNCRNLSEHLIDTYTNISGDSGIIKLLDFYKCYRAYVRGKVESMKSGQAEVSDMERKNARIKAMRYFQLAGLYAAGGFRPCLLVICGLTGTGKTTLANALSTELGLKAISSDIVRKRLAGIEPDQHRYEDIGTGLYSREFTEKTYNEMFRQGEQFLKQGISVVFDATFSNTAHRKKAVELAEKTRAQINFIECALDDDIAKQRLEERLDKTGVVSDGRWEIYLKQKEQYKQLSVNASSFRVNTSGSIEKLAAEALVRLLG